MKILRTKVIQTTTMLLGAAFIAGCGGGSGGGSGSTTQNAINLIADYAQNNTNPVPGILDYSDAGITGVSTDNLAAANAMVDKGVGADYDTATEIQDLIDKIGPKAVLDRNFGDGEHDYIYGIVTSATGKVWLNNNLGARYADSNDANFDPKQQATSKTDFLAYGSLFQWGRKADGHELINRTGPTTGSPKYSSTSTKSNTPTNSLFIRTTSDWRITPSNTLWAGVSAINNICPAGYRLPWGPEIQAEKGSWGAPHSIDEAFGNPLAWTLAGIRNRTSATLAETGTVARYWIAHTHSPLSYYLFITSSGSNFHAEDTRAWGFSVRCIKN